MRNHAEKHSAFLVIALAALSVALAACTPELEEVEVPVQVEVIKEVEVEVIREVEVVREIEVEVPADIPEYCVGLLDAITSWAYVDEDSDTSLIGTYRQTVDLAVIADFSLDPEFWSTTTSTLLEQTVDLLVFFQEWSADCLVLLDAERGGR